MKCGRGSLRGQGSKYSSTLDILFKIERKTNVQSYSAAKKNELPIICNSRNQSPGNYVEWIKPVPKGYILCASMCKVSWTFFKWQDCRGWLFWWMPGVKGWKEMGWAPHGDRHVQCQHSGCAIILWFSRCCHWGTGGRYTGSCCSISYNCIWIDKWPQSGKFNKKCILLTKNVWALNMSPALIKRFTHGL